MQFDLKLPLLGFESVTKMELQKIDEIFLRLESIGDGSLFYPYQPFCPPRILFRYSQFTSGIDGDYP